MSGGLQLLQDFLAIVGLVQRVGDDDDIVGSVGAKSFCLGDVKGGLGQERPCGGNLLFGKIDARFLAALQ